MMRPRTGLLALLAALFSLSAAQADDLPPSEAPPPMSAAGDALLGRMTEVNARVKTLEASVVFDVALRSFPFIKHRLDGNYFYKQPDKQAVVFDTVPALAKEFKHLATQIDPPALWRRHYSFGVVSDESGATTFRLVPLKNGRIEHLDVKVDDATATIEGYVWTYKDGGYVSVDQTVESVNGNYLVTEQNGHVELPAYKADTAAAYSNYKVNVRLQDGVFTQ